MSIKLGTNITSLKAQNELSKGSSALAKTFERLSSGLRINRASDDPAGLSVASKLNTDTRILTQALRNVNDGISLLSTAEAGLQALTSIVNRVQELSEQASNGTLTNAQRIALNTEAQALSQEYARVVNATKFNEISLLNSSSSVSLQVGLDSSTNSAISIDLINLTTASTSAVGDGTFKAETTFSSGARTIQITSGDLNADGFEDLVASDPSATDRVNIMLGNGNGTFKLGVTYFTGVNGDYFSNLVLADFNNDGVQDVIVEGSLNHTVGILLGNSNGTFKVATTFTSYGTGVGSDEEMEVADFNGDGKLDFAVGSDTSGDSVPDVISIRLGNGDGTFKTATSVGVASSRSLSSGELNGDGRTDLVVNTTTGNRVLLGNGDGTFSVGSIITEHFGYANRGIELVDLNGDGTLDLAGYYPTGVNPSYLGVAIGNGNGTFKAIATYTTAATNHNDYNLKVRDLNGDGRPDLILATGSGSAIEVRLNNGSGGFSTATTYTTGDNDSLTLADFNEDGILDIARGSFTTNTIGILLGNGNTSVSSSSTFTVDLTSISGARSALTTMNTLAETLAAGLGKVGAYSSRLSVSLNMIESNIVNFRTAESNITEVGVAEEVAKLVRLQILQKANTALLAQANQIPEIAINLLKSAF